MTGGGYRWFVLGAVAGPALSFGRASAGPRLPILAVEPAPGGWQVARLDPMTLSQVGRASVRLGAFGDAWDWSPTRTRLALGTGSGIVVIDPSRLRAVERIATGPAPEQVVWLSPHTLIAVADFELTAIDPSSRHVLWRCVLPSLYAAIARWKDELLFVLDPTTSTYGTAALLTVKAQGQTASVPLNQIHAGEPRSGSPDQQGADPGIAVDPKAGVAYVVGGGDPVARADLHTLSVSYSPTRQLAAALHGETGPTREAAWVANSVIAVTGFDEHLSDDKGKTTDTQAPAGLSLINTATWTTRRISTGASALTVVGQTVLAYGAPLNLVNSRYVLPTRGIGLSAYTTTGRRTFHVLAHQPVRTIDVAGNLAYAPLTDGHTAVIRIANGARIATTRTHATVTLLSVPPVPE